MASTRFKKNPYIDDIIHGHLCSNEFSYACRFEHFSLRKQNESSFVVFSSPDKKHLLKLSLIKREHYESDIDAAPLDFAGTTF